MAQNREKVLTKLKMSIGRFAHFITQRRNVLPILSLQAVDDISVNLYEVFSRSEPMWL